VSETDNPRTGSSHTGVLDDVLRLSGGFSNADRSWLLEALSGLEPHLPRRNPDSMIVNVSVKHRDGKEQQVTLRAELPGLPPLVARSADRDLARALAEAKRELVHQVEDEKKKREPKSNRLLRKKTT
jgi:ribosome-associated translation inhibitor RaiA